MANEELSKRVYVKDLKDILHYKQVKEAMKIDYFEE